MTDTLPETSDFEVFKAFFRKHGVYCQQFVINPTWQERPHQGRYELMASQAIFEFDENGRYLGVTGDEYGEFQPRIEPEQEASSP